MATMHRTLCRCAVQNILHDVQAAAESRTLIATSSFAQRRAFLMALHDELQRNREAIIRANRRDCDVFGQQQQQRGTPSVTIPPTMPSAAAAASAIAAPHSAAAYTVAAASSTCGTSTPSSRRHSPLEYVASTVLSGVAGGGDTAALNYSAAATAEALGGGAHAEVGNTEEKSGSAGGSGEASADQQTNAGAPPPGAAEARTVVADEHHATPSTASAGESRAYPHAHEVPTGSFFHTEASGGGGHLLHTPDHHLLISPLRLDKLHATIDYLLCQPDPIAVPPSCWLYPYAERGGGDAVGRRHSLLPQAGADSTQHDAGTSQNGRDDSAPKEPCTRYGRCTRLTDQLEVFELPVPLGMVGILSRFRPRISLDAVAMGLFAGNTVLVDGGVSLYYTNIALMTVVRRALTAAGLPASAVVCVESYDTAHRSTSEWLKLSEYVDLAVVCGPPKLYQFASRHSTIPLIRATGQFSSIYVDESASFEVALELILNSKLQKLGAANAVTTAIIHRDFPRYTELLMALSAGGAVLLGDVAAQERVPDSVLELASEEEYQGLSQYGLRDGNRTLCIKTVDSLAQALFFIESYGSKQSDCVVATDPEVCATYCRQVDTAVALVNASTRLSSGVPLGCGVDFAISTSKAHCRGPLTLSMMITRKLVARSRSMHHGALR